MGGWPAWDDGESPEPLRKTIIIHPQADRGKVCTVTLDYDYEIKDYVVCSRQEFYDVQKAKEYARKLAQDNGLEYVPDYQETIFLD